MTEDLLRINGLSTRYFTSEGQVNAVSDLDLRIEQNEIFGIVGESGSGKSVTARSVMGLIESPGRITAGEVWYRNDSLATAVADRQPEAVDGSFVDLLSLPDGLRQSLRGTSFSMIFQDPESSFNPTLTVGEQLAEAVEVQQRANANPRSTRARTNSKEYSLTSLALSTVLPSKRYVSDESRTRAIELLELVGIPDPVQRAEQYPHEYSGGMLQRAMIAQALAGEPDVLIADEPTTALDVTIQAQILDLLDELQAKTGMTVLLITHNLGVIARMCDRVGVMYAGELVERGPLSAVFDDHIHPYTRGLLESMPTLETAGDRLKPIDGNVPSLLDGELRAGCSFADRCPKAMERCLEPVAESVVERGGDDEHKDGDGDKTHHARCVLTREPYDETRALPEEYFASDESDGGGTDEGSGGKRAAGADEPTPPKRTEEVSIDDR